MPPHARWCSTSRSRARSATTCCPAAGGARRGGPRHRGGDVNVDLSGYSREHVAQLRCTPAWPRLRELAVPSAEELGAIERFPLDPAGYRSLGVPVALLAGELSRHRPPYGGALERVRATLGVHDVALLPGQDHVAHVTAPDLLARTLVHEIARMAVEHSA